MNLKRLSPFISTILLLIFQTSSGQQTQSSFRLLTVADGIPQAYISGIVQDGYGFIWIATRDGLSRYDGKHYMNFRNERGNSSSLSSNIIDKLSIDKRGRLWITYEQGEVDVMDARTMKIERLSNSPGLLKLKNELNLGDEIIHDDGDQHFVVTNKGELIHINMPGRFYKKYSAEKLFPELKEKFITGLSSTADGLVLTLNRSLVFTDKALQIKESARFDFPNPDLYDEQLPWKDIRLLVKSDGRILIPDANRLIIYTPSNGFTVQKLPKQRYYTSPVILSSKKLDLLAYDHFLFEVDEEGRISENHFIKDQKSSVTAMLIDRSGVLWLGTNGYGLQLYNTRISGPPSFHYRKNFPLSVLSNGGISEKELNQTFIPSMNPYYFRWAADTIGHTWIAKAGNRKSERLELLNISPDGELLKRVYRPGKGSQDIEGLEFLAISSEGNLWAIDHQFRLMRFDQSDRSLEVYNTLTPPFPKDKLNEINGLVMDGEDHFWISTSQGILFHDLNKNTTRQVLKDYDNLHPMCFSEDPFDSQFLWIGTYSDGLIKYNKIQDTIEWPQDSGSPPMNTVYGMVVQGNDLWCSGNKGVFKINLLTHESTVYRTEGNTPIDEFNRFHFFRHADGKIAFGGTHGYTEFDPAEISEDHYHPELAITSLLINSIPFSDLIQNKNKSVILNETNRLELKYDQNFINVEFAALQFNNPERITYRHRMNGLEDEWSITGNSGQAIYTSLPPGDYELIINASNTSGNWSRHVKKLTIHISPPYWQSWWFRLILVTTILGAILFFMKQKLLRQVQMADERFQVERKTMELEALVLRAQMNPHFLFNCLNSIKSLIQDGKRDEAVLYLTSFAKLMRAQLEGSSRESNLDDELKSVRLYLELEQMRFENKIEFSIELSPELDVRSLTLPASILQPIVENSVIHGLMPKNGKGTIRIVIEKVSECIVCCIIDNGVGRMASARSRKHIHDHKSRGLQLISDRIKLHNEMKTSNIELSIYDLKDEAGMAEGTNVRLCFKFN